MSRTIAVIGGGASGMMAAGIAAQNGAEVFLLEKNEKLGKKIYITGKGRCNLSNTASKEEFLQNVVTNEKFLISPLSRFSYDDLVNFCKENKLKLKVERGGRVFPESDKSSDVIKMLEKFCKKNNVHIELNSNVFNISKYLDSFYNVKYNDKSINVDAVIIACGGKSYSQTGSTGDGLLFAKSLDIKYDEFKSALVPICLEEDVSSLEGLSLKNVELSAVENNKVVKKLFGEMLFTDKGISGPIALSMSSYMNKLNASHLYLSLKPKVSASELNDRLLSDISKTPNIIFKNLLPNYLPSKMIGYFIKLSKIDENKKLNSITVEERMRIISLLTCMVFKIKRKYDVEYGIISSGGINVNELNPKTMETKKHKSLYFCGETVDVDALTGGYNLHIAFATGYVAGLSAASDNILKIQ